MKQTQILSVQALRGIGGLLVVMAHLAMRELDEWPKAHFRLMYPTHFFGFGGVEVFFVISGFIITITTLSKFGNPAAIWDYALKRFYRIYPLYWILSAVVIAALAFSGNHQWRDWFSSFFLLPGFTNQLNPVSWSLIHEVIFYSFWGVFMFASPRLLPVFLSVWAIATWVRWFAPNAILPNWVYADVMFHLYNFSFMFGVAIALLAKQKRFYFPGAFLTFGVIVLSIGAYLSSVGLVPHLQGQPYCLLFLETTAAFIVYGAIGLEHFGRWTMPAWLIYVGDASYSVYLVHYMVLMAVRPYYALFADSSVFIQSAWTLLVFAVAVTLGLLCYRFIEKPLLELCYSKLASAKPKIPPKAPPDKKREEQQEQKQEKQPAKLVPAMSGQEV